LNGWIMDIEGRVDQVIKRKKRESGQW
jgi:hypothetical protein